MTEVRVGLIQTKNSTDLKENVERTISKIREAHTMGAQIVSTQELFPGQYFCQSEDHARFEEAEPIPGPTTHALCQIAKELKLVIVGSLFERRDAGLYHNTAVIIDADGTCLGKYRKMHIPDDPLYYEKFYFTPGDLGFKSWQTKYAKIGVLVCWDQWYPEGARITAMKGAQILFYPTAIGWHPSEKEEYGAAQHNAWQTMMRSHAIANGLYVAAANRTGMEGNIEFWGASFFADPYGKLLQQAPHTEEAILVQTCDLDLINTARTHWPFLRDRRIDAYEGLLKRYLDE